MTVEIQSTTISFYIDTSALHKKRKKTKTKTKQLLSIPSLPSFGPGSLNASRDCQCQVENVSEGLGTEYDFSAMSNDFALLSGKDH